MAERPPISTFKNLKVIGGLLFSQQLILLHFGLTTGLYGTSGTKLKFVSTLSEFTVKIP